MFGDAREEGLVHGGVGNGVCTGTEPLGGRGDRILRGWLVASGDEALGKRQANGGLSIVHDAKAFELRKGIASEG